VPVEIAAGKSGTLAMPAVLSFQGCTENQCLLPEKREFTIQLKVAD